MNLNNEFVENIEFLPIEILFRIFLHLPIKSISVVAQVCKCFYSISKEEKLWKEVCFRFERNFIKMKK